MQTSERGQFDEQWKNAFEGSEAAPSDKVWLSVESALANAQNDINKRRVVYYQRLAATLLFLCVASALVIFWQGDGAIKQQMADSSDQHPLSKKSDSSIIEHKDSSAARVEPLMTVDNSGNRNSENSKKRRTSSTLNFSLPNKHRGKHSNTVAGSEIVNSESINSASQLLHDSLPGDHVTSNSDSTIILATNANEQSKPLTEEEEKAIVKKMLSDAGVGSEDNTEEKKMILKNPAWISIGASGGSYATQAAVPTPTALADFATQSKLYATAYDQTITTNKPASTGTAYSFGFMAGKPLSKRWLLQAGLTYVNRKSDYESNIIANGDQVFYPQIVKSNVSSSYSFTNSYAITSTTEFLSVPVQLGFVIIDRKIGWIINSGISGDIFLKNTLVDKSGTYRLVSQSDGEDTAYRTISWSGLASTEVNLRLSEHYRFALVPGLRYSITNIVKDESGYVKPLTVDIGFRFRYTF